MDQVVSSISRLPKWIPVSERKPTKDDADSEGRVIYCPRGELFLVAWNATMPEREGWTHWMSARDLLHPLPVAEEEKPEMFDFLVHLRRQRDWSQKTFGPGDRAKGVVDHIRKELLEIEQHPTDLEEWIDVVILALDGAWRAGYHPGEIVMALTKKQAKNEARNWPDWRTMPTDKAIEHDRTGEKPKPAAPVEVPAGYRELAEDEKKGQWIDGAKFWSPNFNGWLIARADDGYPDGTPAFHDERIIVPIAAPVETEALFFKKCDIPLGSVLHFNTWGKPDGTAWVGILQVCNNGGVLIATTEPEWVTWERLAEEFHISRDFGKTWEPCRKRAVTVEAEKGDAFDSWWKKQGITDRKISDWADDGLANTKAYFLAVAEAAFKAGKEAK